MSVLAAATSLNLCVLAGLLAKHRQHAVFRAASAPFCGIILFGALLGCLFVIGECENHTILHDL
jgi:uncharacterized membrane protein YfcA